MKPATLLSVGLGIAAGWFWADELRRRRTAEARVEELTRSLDQVSFKIPPERQLKKIAVVLNDAHKRITAVSKALEKPVS